MSIPEIGPKLDLAVHTLLGRKVDKECGGSLHYGTDGLVWPGRYVCDWCSYTALTEESSHYTPIPQYSTGTSEAGHLLEAFQREGLGYVILEVGSKAVKVTIAHKDREGNPARTFAEHTTVSGALTITAFKALTP